MPKLTMGRNLPAAIWVLGLVSLFMDISSEMIHAYLPLFLVNVLGASALTVGVIEGIAEATASITKMFSGTLSDWLGRRKFLTALGYGLAAFTKPVFPLASTIGWVFAARFIDRIGKGVRDAPRDALIADIAPPELRGASYGPSVVTHLVERDRQGVAQPLHDHAQRVADQQHIGTAGFQQLGHGGVVGRHHGDLGAARLAGP